MNKKYRKLIKLVFLVLLILILLKIAFDDSKIKISYALDTSSLFIVDAKPIKIIDSPMALAGNQFWSNNYNYKISSQITIASGSSLSIQNGTNIEIINNGSFSINGGVLNISSPDSDFVGTSTNNRPTDFLSGINNYSNNEIGLSVLDNIFASPVYKSSNILSTEINVIGSGYSHIFSVNNSGILNVRKTNIKGVAGNNTNRTIVGLYKSSKINLFETNINSIETRGTEFFYADNSSRVVLYKTNVTGFVGTDFADIFSSASLDIFRSNLSGIIADTAINLFSGGILNFQKSEISAVPINADSVSSGICISAYDNTTINVSTSDIGPCFIAFHILNSGNFKINQNNISGNSDSVFSINSHIDLSNNWWGSRAGPKTVDLSSLSDDYSDTDYIRAIKNQNAIEKYGDAVLSTMPFSPVPFRESTCCSSVLFIPGLQGSRLYKKGFLGVENQLWEPNRNKDVESLFLNSSGQPLDSSIYTKDIIAKTNFFGPLGALDIYQSIVDILSKEKADGNISDFQTLPYDWRKLPSDITSSGIKTDSYILMLKDKIKEMASKSSSGKVIIVAHSYGGLLAKYLAEQMEKDGEDDKIESIVLVSTPEYGTPQSIPSMFYGDNEDLLGGLILSQNNAKSLAKNMPSAYMLLPSSNYFSQSDGVNNQKNLINFDNWAYSHFGLTYTKADSFPIMSDSLKKIFSVNNIVFNNAENEHNLIDNYSANLSGKTYSILGVGVPTLSGITYIKPKCRGFFFCTPSSLPEFTRKYSLMGDGVVIAHNLAARSGSVFTVDIGKENEVRKTMLVYYKESPIDHKDVFRSSGVKDVLHAIISRSKKESQGSNSFGELSNPYVSYVSGSLSKPGPILGSYGDSSVLSNISKISEDASNSDFVQRFNNSKVLIAEAYGPIILKTNFKEESDISNKPFSQLDLTNRIVNTKSYVDNNRTGIVSVISCEYFNCLPTSVYTSTLGTSSSTYMSAFNTNVFGQGGGVGNAQIVTRVDDTEMIYPIISVTPSTNLDINYSTTTIAIDNNADGVIDRTITPIQINQSSSTSSTTGTIGDGGSVGTSTGSLPVIGSDSIEDLFTKARLRIQAFASSSISASTSISSTSSSTSSSYYLANKYIEKLNIAERKYQKVGVLQSLNLLNNFYDGLESNMSVISDLINTYNKTQDFYALNNFLGTSQRVLFLTERQKNIRDEILVYAEIHNVYSELIQKLGTNL